MRANPLLADLPLCPPEAFAATVAETSGSACALDMNVPHSSLLNYALYQVGWFACILGAAWHWPLTGFGIAVVLTAAHVWLAADRTIEARLVLLALGCGVAVEAFQVWSGTYHFTSGALISWISPPWLLAMWAQFATTFRFSMRGLMAHPARAAVFGVLGGPIAFLAGERLGAVTLPLPLAMGLLRLAVTWGVALYLLARVVRASTPPSLEVRYRAL
jgi:hypothetical protein